MDQENGSLTAEPSAPSTETPTQESNLVSDALSAFDKELGRSSPEAPATETTTEAPTQETQEAPQDTVQARVLEGLEGPEVDYFKRMSNAAYGALYPRFLQSKKDAKELETLRAQLAEAQGKDFYTEPDGYKITPEYSQLAQQASTLDAQLDHYQKQLRAVKTGQPWYPLVKNAQGEVVLGEAKEPSPEDEATILSLLTRGNSMKASLDDKLSSFSGNFKAQHESYISSMQAARAQIFKGVDPAKLSQAAKSKATMFPSYVRQNPAVQMLCESMVVIDGLIAMLKDAKGVKTTQAVKDRTSNVNGPRATSGANPGKGNTVNDALKGFRDAGFLKAPTVAK